MDYGTPKAFQAQLPNWCRDAFKEKEKLEKLRLLLLSKKAQYWAGKGGIRLDEALQLSMVCFCAELRDLFPQDTNETLVANTISTSLRRTIDRLRQSTDTFLALFLEPDLEDIDDIFEDDGVFLLPSILMQSPPLADRQGNTGREEKMFERRRWEVPLFYILSRVVYDVMNQYSAGFTVEPLLKRIENLTKKVSSPLLSNQEAGTTLFLFDLLLSGEQLPEGMSLKFVVNRLSRKS